MCSAVISGFGLEHFSNSRRRRRKWKRIDELLNFSRVFSTPKHKSPLMRLYKTSPTSEPLGNLWKMRKANLLRRCVPRRFRVSWKFLIYAPTYLELAGRRKSRNIKNIIKPNAVYRSSRVLWPASLFTILRLWFLGPRTSTKTFRN
jgi:hypothetical protein